MTDQMQNELAEIADELTALADMVPALFNYEDMEKATPKGLKIIIMGIRKRVESLRGKREE